MPRLIRAAVILTLSWVSLPAQTNSKMAGALVNIGPCSFSFEEDVDDVLTLQLDVDTRPTLLYKIKTRAKRVGYQDLDSILSRFEEDMHAAGTRRSRTPSSPCQRGGVLRRRHALRER